MTAHIDARHFPLGEFVRAKRKTNLGNVIGQRKNSPRKSWISSYFFYCSREQIRLAGKWALHSLHSFSQYVLLLLHSLPLASVFLIVPYFLEIEQDVQDLLKPTNTHYNNLLFKNICPDSTWGKSIGDGNRHINNI
jgi:hypothetical protein